MILLVLPTFLDTPYKIIPQITLEGTAWYDLYLVFTIIGKDTFHIGGNGAPPIYSFNSLWWFRLTQNIVFKSGHPFYKMRFTEDK